MIARAEIDGISGFVTGASISDKITAELAMAPTVAATSAIETV
jgi:hypothetical protein